MTYVIATYKENSLVIELYTKPAAFRFRALRTYEEFSIALLDNYSCIQLCTTSITYLL